MFHLLTLLPHRFIPTAVGNANVSPVDVAPASVHPHGCGERNRATRALPKLDGSSPRLWGTLFFFDSWFNINLFIPTAVGNAMNATLKQTLLAVHPHGCGERKIGGVQTGAAEGSSPRLWGTRDYTNQWGN